MTSQARKMPTKKAIRIYWASYFDVSRKGFDSEYEFMESDYCFACGDTDSRFENGYTERAHIVAKTNGGSDYPHNLHLLCNSCHKDSEFLEGLDYWAWFLKRSSFDARMSDLFRMGAISASDIINMMTSISRQTP